MYQTTLRYFLVTIAALGAFALLKHRILNFLMSKNIMAVNYSGKDVVNGAGLLLSFSSLASSLLLLLIDYDSVYIMYFFMVLTLSFAGLLDDVLGDSSAKGISGHIRNLLRGGFSTGIIKAGTGLVLGIGFALNMYYNLIIFFIDVVLFVLCVNAMNLLDLRPGRAIKGWLIAVILFLLLGRFSQVWILLPLFAGICLYIRDEMNEIYMLGDTGSSLLGGIAGFYAVTALPLTAKVFFMLLLIAFHILTEHVSLSVCIENISILRKLDRLGRKDSSYDRDKNRESKKNPLRKQRKDRSPA